MSDYMPTQVFYLTPPRDGNFCEICGTNMTDTAVVDYAAQTVDIEIPSCFGDQYLHFTLSEFLDHYREEGDRMPWWDGDLFEVLYDTVEEEICS